MYWIDLLSYSLLLSIDRSQSVAEAYDTVELALKYSNESNDHHARVVGIDLSGDPNVSYVHHNQMCGSNTFTQEWYEP